MIDTRALGQELQEQVLAAARKGRRRVTTTVRNVAATAQMIRPQLPAIPPITIKLPSADQLAQLTEAQFSQLREKAPAIIARLRNPERLAQLTERQLSQLSQLREKAPGLIARLPDADDIRASAADFAEQVQTVQHQVTDRVRTVASPLAHQAATALAQATAQVTGSAAKTPTAAVTGNGTPGGGTSKTAAKSDTTAAERSAHADKSAAAEQPARKSPPAAKAKPVRAATRGASTPKKSKPSTK